MFFINEMSCEVELIDKGAFGTCHGFSFILCPQINHPYMWDLLLFKFENIRLNNLHHAFVIILLNIGEEFKS
jgi:hypothetical protein